jgi:hypothetical protein
MMPAFRVRLSRRFWPPCPRARERGSISWPEARRAIRHQLCIDYGVDVFARGSRQDGTEMVELNVSCIDGIELAKLAMSPIDGRNR